MHFSIFQTYILYATVFVLSAYFASQYARSKNLSKYYFFFLAISFPSVLACLRGIEVGTDYSEYVRHIGEITDIKGLKFEINNLSSDFEVGFNLLIFIISRFTDYIPLIVYFIYVFAAIFVLMACTRLVDNKYVFWAYLYYLFSFWLFGFNGLRQAIAMSISLYSISLIHNNNAVKYTLFVLLACSFHLSAIVLLPLHFIYNSVNKNLEKMLYILIIVSIIIISLRLDFFSELLGYGNYTNNPNYVTDIFEGRFRVFQQAIIILPMIILNNKLIKFDNINILHFRILYLYIISLLLSVQVTQAVRVSMYFELITVVISVQIIRYISKSNNKFNLLYFIYFFSYFILYKFIYVYRYSGEVIPYYLV